MEKVQRRRGLDLVGKRGTGMLPTMLLVLGVLYLSTSLLHAASWQDASKELPRVTVGEISANPGSNVMIPVYFTPDPRTPLSSLSIEIDYVSNNLKFQKVASGLAIEQIGGQIETSLTEGKPDDKNVTRSKLRVDFSFGEQQPPEGLPEGLLGFLLFDVSVQAKAFSIKLNTTVLSAEDMQTPPKTVTNISAQSGIVTVELSEITGPEVLCFFFSH